MFKKYFIATLGLFLLVTVGAGCGKKPAGPPPTGPMDIKVTQGTGDTKQVVTFQKALVKVALDYKEAQILTNAVLLTKLQSIKKEDYKALCDKAVQKWVDVQKDANALEPFTVERKTTSVDTGNISSVFSTKALINTLRDAVLIYPVYAEETEVQLDMPKWDKVNMITRVAPSANTVKIVQNVFGTTAKDAQKIMEQHYQDEAAAWGNWIKGYDIASKTAQAIKTASKVGLFIGGAVITAGGSAVLTMPAGAAVATGFGSSVGAVGGTVIAVNGVDMALEVSENTANLAFGNEKLGAQYTQARDTISPLTTLLSVVDLKSGMENPGNLYTIYDLGSNVLSSGYDYFTVSVANNQVKGAADYRANMPPMSLNADGMLKQLPKNIVYLVATDQPLPPKYPTADELKKMFPNFGVYRGTARFETAIMDKKMTLTADLTVTVSKQGDVTYNFSDKGNIPYLIPGSNEAMSADYTFDGEFTGKMADNKLQTSGGFNEWAKVNLPSQYAAYLPPEMKAKLSNTAKGTGHAEGNSSGLGGLEGTISLTANGKTVDGTWQAQME
ncbi:MAG: hypothetical protein PHC53_05915 [Patescibacteria group bacterium]|nr:hypothetical protein [Patescibacteria group bacterium]